MVETPGGKQTPGSKASKKQAADAAGDAAGDGGVVLEGSEKEGEKREGLCSCLLESSRVLELSLAPAGCG